jgi:hypothetical protein
MIESAVIAAIVAVLVSFLTQGVQLWIARRSRVSIEAAPARQLLSDERKAQLATIKQIQGETENLRLHIWTLQGFIERGRLSKSDIASLAETVSALRHSVGDFGRNWGQVKFDFPASIQGRMRRLWHELRLPFQVLEGIQAAIRRLEGAQPESQHDESRLPDTEGLFENLRAADKTLRYVLQQLREFSELLAVAKSYLLGDLAVN